MKRPRWKRWVLLAIAVVLLVHGAIAARPYDQSYAVFTENHGRIESGRRFGLEVGMTVEEARAELARRGWQETRADVVEMIGRRQPRFARTLRESEVVLRLDILPLGALKHRACVLWSNTRDADADFRLPNH